MATNQIENVRPPANQSEPVNPSDDPLFVSANESIGISLVTQQLTGSNNYIPWKKSMEMALGVKMKLGFAQGKFPRPDDPYQQSRWEKCNNVILSWLINSVSKDIAASLIHSQDCIQAWSSLQMRFASSNGARRFNLHKEITTLTQGDKDIASYYGKLVQMWGEKDALDEDDLCDLGSKCKSTKTMDRKKTRNRIMQFLMGLNDVYIPVRTQILAMRPAPNIEEVYEILTEEEAQRGASKLVVPEVSAMYSSQRQNYNGRFQNPSYNRNNNGGFKNRKNLFCSHCNMQGHTKDICYKIHGYPPGHKLHKSYTQRQGKTMANNVTNSICNSTDAGQRSVNACNSDGNVYLSNVQVTQEQLNKLLNLINSPEAS